MGYCVTNEFGREHIITWAELERMGMGDGKKKCLTCGKVTYLFLHSCPMKPREN